MFIEIEETVCFLSSYLYGKIPRSRVDVFCEKLANGLAERIYDASGQPCSTFSLVVKQKGGADRIVVEAVQEAYLKFALVYDLLPELSMELAQGSVLAVFADPQPTKQIYPLDNFHEPILPHPVEQHQQQQHPKDMAAHSPPTPARPKFHIEFSVTPGMEKDANANPRPSFEVQGEEQLYTAQAFAATRFGSTKLKTYQEAGDAMQSRFGGGSSPSPDYGSHPFTMPSLYAYLRLLSFLNAAACVAGRPEKRDVGECPPRSPSLHTAASHSSISQLSSVTGVTDNSSDLSGEPEALTDQLLKCELQHDSGAYTGSSSVASSVDSVRAPEQHTAHIRAASH